ncbi:MAG: ATP-binding cassette domain-containing protein [Spirochaetes bacterium]|jgi:oligopeptide/dipeptide ABC transporter ATP-binding protein|nr:ATP-binding cassette domain-containing protein [Spirochaetota bacterium]
MSDTTKDTVLRVENVKTYFSIGGESVRAVDDVSFEVKRGEIVGIVGESGCGKSTLGRTVLHLEERTSGSVDYGGLDPAALSGDPMKQFRRRTAMVFQDPSASLNPRKRVDKLLEQPLRVHGVGGKDEWTQKIHDIFQETGISDESRNRYPHQFSGGQKQRLGIARALMLDPEFIVLDEAVSALDVSIQAQILNLLLDLQERRDLTYLFIGHDLAVVEFVSDRILVMYLGRVVEAGPKREIMDEPLHPYTKALMSAFPTTDLATRGSSIKPIEGDVPSPINPPAGCHFAPRCPFAMDKCFAEYPPTVEKGPQHRVACWLHVA